MPVRARHAACRAQRRISTPCPSSPTWIPYRTSYYAGGLGLLPAATAELAALRRRRLRGRDRLRRCADGTLTYGECLHRRARPTTRCSLSAHVCHPSLANDNLLGHRGADRSRPARSRRRARGSATGSCSSPAPSARSPGWRATRPASTRIKHGLVAGLRRRRRRPHYKRSRRGDASIDRAVAHVLDRPGEHQGSSTSRPYGYDERQFCSPGFDLPVGCLHAQPLRPVPRVPHLGRQSRPRRAPRTSPIRSRDRGASSRSLERDRTLPQPLAQGRAAARPARPLCRDRAATTRRRDRHGAALGAQPVRRLHTLLDIAERAGLPYHVMLAAARALADVGLIADAEKGA